MKSFDSSGERSFVSAKPACVVAGFLLCHSVEALVPRAPITEIRSHQRRSCVRPRGAGGLRCSTSEGGAENVDSSEIYAAVRNRLKELEKIRKHGEERLPPSQGGQHNDLDSWKATDGDELWAYSGTEMRKAYYEAFWRARNLGNREKIDWEKNDDEVREASESITASARETNLSPAAMSMVMSRNTPLDNSDEDEDVVSASEVQGLTQAYYLVEEEVTSTMTSPARTNEKLSAVAYRNIEQDALNLATPGAAVAPWDALEPQGLTQLFYLDAEQEEAVAQTLPETAPSFLCEKLGVPGTVVRDLRQVELDHARLAMLAVLLTGAVGAGVPTSTDFGEASVGLLNALAHVARTPWLDPCVAGGILALKALSEGDWRLGKGALADWADHSLRAASDVGARVFGLASGDVLRKLAVDMEVRHGRMALGAVVCAMAQQGFVTMGA